MSLHIHAPKPDGQFIRYFRCRRCRCKRRCVVRTYEWYPPITTCSKGHKLP